MIFAHLWAYFFNFFPFISLGWPSLQGGDTFPPEKLGQGNFPPPVLSLWLWMLKSSIWLLDYILRQARIQETDFIKKKFQKGKSITHFWNSLLIHNMVQQLLNLSMTWICYNNWSKVEVGGIFNENIGWEKQYAQHFYEQCKSSFHQFFSEFCMFF